MPELTLTHPSYHRKALLLSLLALARLHLDGIALTADAHADHPCGTEVLGQTAQLSRVLREIETLLQHALEV
jgi:hypothetical protein